MRFRNRLLENFLLPLSDMLLKYEVSKQLHLHRQYAKLSEIELNDLQRNKLHALLEHAVKTVATYNQFGDFRNENTLQYLSNFPVLTKLKLHGREQDYLSNIFNPSRLVKLESSGSSGFKTTVYITKKEHSILRAILITWWEWTGYYLGKSILQTGITPNRGFIKSLKDWFTNTVYSNAFGMDENEAISKLAKISRYKKPHVGGFSSSLYVLAEYAEKHELDIHFDAAISWGDKMFDHYKRKIEKVFNTKVYENYGCNEGLMIGQKVDLDYFYIYTPNIYLEILDDDDQQVPDGEIGRVVITKLDGYAMPLIRYDTGDLAIKLPRECYPENRLYNFPLLQKVIGRNTDIIKTLDGKNLIVHTFTGIFEFYEEILQFRVIQRELDRIEIEYIPSESFNLTVLQDLERDIRKKANTCIQIAWRKVDVIPRTGSGKPQLIKNYLIEKSLSDVK